ncbi:MAG TPA: Hpt domain-containing protein, partial [Bryobacteraceae bacterium]|nr:Hpt domain-containing protein [Bryobacteraceae bacterium]
MASPTPATLHQLLETLAAELANPISIPERLPILQRSLLNLAEMARSQGRDNVARMADETAGILSGAQSGTPGLSAELANGVERMQQALAEKTEAAPASKQASLAEDAELIADFVHEAREHLESIESQLLAVEENRNAAEAVHAIFRSFHTIKGLAGFLEFSLIQEVAHEVETFLDRVRQGNAKLTPAAVDIVLESRDYIGKWLRLLDGGPTSAVPPELADTSKLLGRVRSL